MPTLNNNPLFTKQSPKPQTKTPASDRKKERDEFWKKWKPKGER